MPRRFSKILALMGGWPLRRAAGALLCVLLLGPLLVSAWEPETFLDAAAKLSPRTQQRARALVQLIEKGSAQSDEARLTLVNNYFNQNIEFYTDQETWGVEDYWATPLESLEQGRGDCEDYAIAKYFTLLAMGVPEPRLRLVYVRAMLHGRPQAHMVLAYYAQVQGEPLVLDNLVADVRAASQRPDLAPVFSFNSEGLWHGVGATRAGNPLQRLTQWRDLIGRLRAQGF
ncbi:transglutaminase-like cysteine peptidase [Roseateles sp. BYS180W]|uniref:Transglutaminase-like cysteine peptidase n=1 Tax=Roseateles rivi TaxID=3299028 RepID=A0ABW7FYG0_9BURK